MRKTLCKALLCLLLIPTSFISCTTSDDNSSEEESVEGELNSELDDMSGVEDGEVAEGDASVDDTEFDDFEDDASGGDSSTTASTDDGGAGGDDDEFFAEDADQPASDSQDMAEKDLQKELEKGTEAGAEPTATAGGDMPLPVDATPAATSSASSGSGSAITSKESPISTSGFEDVAPPTLAKPNEDLGISDPLVADVDPPLPAEKAAKEVVPISKVPKEPFFKNQRLMNTIYIARQGDDLGTISQKLFDKDNIQVLLQDNPRLADGVSVGDKVFYNSPNRPNDNKEILTYYEDKKLPAQYYITKQGDNIQKIGREVLGHDDAWKEIWAINDVLQTQALLPPGLKIRYWSGNEMAEPPPEAPTMASTDSPDMSGAGSMANNSTPPPTAPPDTQEALPDMPDASSDDQMASTETTPMPPDIATSAPSTPPVMAKEGGDSLLTVAGIAIIGLAVITLVAIQIKNRKRDDGSIPPSMEFTKV